MKGEGEEGMGDDAIILGITTGWATEMLTELWKAGGGRQEGKGKSMNSVWTE